VITEDRSHPYGKTTKIEKQTKTHPLNLDLVSAPAFEIDFTLSFGMVLEERIG
jgi:hypothetical protein